MTSLDTFWTLIPNGRTSDGDFKMSAFVSWRLYTQNGAEVKLEAFPSLLQWPETFERALSSEYMTVNFGSNPHRARRADPNVLDNTLWTKLFPNNILVRPFKYKSRINERVFSFGAGDIATAIKQIYDSATTSNKDCDCTLEKISKYCKEGHIIAKSVPGSYPVDSVSTDVDLFSSYDYESPLQNFGRASLFYDYGESNCESESLPLIPKEFDFLEIVASLGNYPSLLRKLGIVIDLIVTRGQFTPDYIFVDPVIVPGTNISLITDIGRNFRTLPDDGSLIAQNGLLKLDTNNFFVETVDIDGTALKLDAYTQNARLSVFPALYTGGFTIGLKGRDNYYLSRLLRQNDLNNDYSIHLKADDILRGYRIDVLVNNSKWHSLCFRRGTMIVADYPVLLPSKVSLERTQNTTDLAEGYITGTSASKPICSPYRINIHEALFGWDGWSLVVSRPGRTIPNTDETGQPQPERIINKTPPGYTFSITTDLRSEPRTLPKLRFGYTYRFRARVVDLAGNSVPLEKAVFSNASPSKVFRRWEPVSPPVLVLLYPITEGESVERLVIRSDKGVSSKGYARNLNIQQFAKVGTTYLATCERWLAPPKVTQMMAELHGMFDSILSTPTSGNIQRAYDISKKESGTFLDVTVLDTSVDPPIERQAKRVIFNPLDGSRYSLPLNARGDTLKNGHYVLHLQKPLIPYLTDPIATGVALLENGGSSATYMNITRLALHPWIGVWPEIKISKLILIEEPTNALFTITQNTESITVAMRKGTMLTLTIASTIKHEQVENMENYNSANLDINSIADGTHPMFSPGRSIHFVHAVQRPTTKPNFNIATFQRLTKDSTFVSIKGTVYSDEPAIPIGNSTGKLTLHIFWADYIDVPNSNDDPTIPLQFSANPITITPRYNDSTLFVKSQYDFGDTKAHDIKCFWKGSTRYREYLPPKITMNDANLNVDGISYETIIIKSSVRPIPLDIKYVIPAFLWINNPDGSRTRQSSGLRVFINRQWYDTGKYEELGVIVQEDDSSPETNVCSVAAADPIWLRDSIKNKLAKSDFISYEHSGPYQLADNTDTVTVIGYLPQWDSERRLWYFDVQLNKTLISHPFPVVRLALVRFQPFSLDNLHISTHVFTDHIFMLPDRTCSVTKQSSMIKVLVSGYFSSSQLNSGRKVIAQIEKFSGIAPQPDDLGWLPEGEAIQLRSSINSEPNNTIFEAFFAEPVSGVTPTTFRVAIRELEYYSSDDDTKEYSGEDALPYRSRIVFAATFLI